MLEHGAYLCRLRRWADLAAFALDAYGDERTEALLALSEELEDALEAAVAADGQAAA